MTAWPGGTRNRKRIYCRYINGSGISRLSAQWRSHTSIKRFVSLNALWSGRKKVLTNTLKSSRKSESVETLSVSQLVSIQSSALCGQFLLAEGSLSLVGSPGVTGWRKSTQNCLFTGMLYVDRCYCGACQETCNGLNRVDEIQEPVTRLS